MSASQPYPALEPESTTVSEEETTFHLLLPQGAQVRSAHLRVGGATHAFWENLMAPAFGATITPPFEEGTEPACESLVVDFHGLRAVDSLKINANWESSARYCRLQAWAGITWHQPQPMASYVFSLSDNGDPSQDSLTEVTFPELEVQKLMISFHNTSAPATDGNWAMALVTPTQLELHCRSVPSNLTLRIGDGPLIWTHSGPLAKELTAPGLADALNEYLANETLPEDEPVYRVPIIIRSDAVGKVTLSLETLAYFFIVDRFADASEEKTLTFGCNQPWTQSAAFELPNGAVVQRAEVKLSGDFAADRFVSGAGPTSDPFEEYAALVSPEHWTAQAITLAENLTLSGVDLLLTPLTEKTELTVEIQPDINQAPSREAEAVAELVVESPTGSACWYCPAFAAPVELEADQPYWLVLKGKDGQASWQAQASGAVPESLRYSKDEGQTWTQYDLAPWGQKGMMGCLRLRHLLSDPALPISVSVGATSLDLGELVLMGAVDSPVSFGDSLTETGTIPISVRASSSGQLILSDLRVEYELPAEVPSGEPLGEEIPSVEEEPTKRPPAREILANLLAERDVRVIDGVGPHYAWRLKMAGVKTIAQLSDLERDSLPTIPGIPADKLSWLRHQASVVMGVEVDAKALAPLLDLTVSQISYAGLNRLVAFFDGSEREQAAPEVAQLMETLETLAEALDDSFLSYCRLRDLS